MEQKKSIWTIGHSTRSIDEFINVLQIFNINVLADIRTFPGSRRYPHFNKESLAMKLVEHNIQYNHFPELGGRRRPVADSSNTAWRNPSFQGYADYMQTEDFKRAVNNLEMI